LVYHGPGIAARILTELDAYLARDGFASLDDAVGRDAATLTDARVDRSRRVT
jgi:dihydroorotate dehydrogenase